MNKPPVTFRHPSGVITSIILGAALWTCICIALVWTLTACAVAPITISPARIVCVMDGVTIWDYTVDAATLDGGEITSITLGADTAEFDAPIGAVCEVR